MNNKETLQNYNNRLNTNNITLDNILETINTLPEAKEIVLQDKEITPTKEVQVVSYDEAYNGLNQVTVKAIPNEYIIPKLQDKSIEITENGTQTIIADEGYDGLNNVSVTTNIEASGGNVECGMIVTGSTDGYLTEIETFGFKSIPNYYMYINTSSTEKHTIFSKLQHIKLNEGLESVGSYAFYNGVQTSDFSFPSTLKTIGDRAFYGCKGMTLNKLPEGIQKIDGYSFYNCQNLALTKLPNSLTTLGTFAFCGGTSTVAPKNTIKTIPNGVTALGIGIFVRNATLIQMSMQNVKTIGGSASANGTFSYCTGLKAVWIGSAITTIAQYAFSNITNTMKIYIDLPRATVEAMSNYSSKWGATNSIIICNDDTDFITKSSFDAIDWATYTG